MSMFSVEDRLFIEKIINEKGYSRNFINITSKLYGYPNVRVKIDFVNCESSFLFTTSIPGGTTEEINNIILQEKDLTEKLISSLLLLESLEEKKLIFLYTPANPSGNPTTFGEGAVNASYAEMFIYDEKITQLLMRYVDKEIIPKQSLIEIYSNKYKSLSEVQFNKQIIVAWCAIVASIVIGLAGLFNKSDSTDLNPLIESISGVEKSISSLAIEKNYYKNNEIYNGYNMEIL